MTARAAAIPLLVALGCGPAGGGFGDVRTTLDGRLSADAHWDGTDDADRAADRAADLMAEPLTVERAVQIALLHDPRLQAELDDLGMAGAELSAAARLPNPEADVEVRFGEDHTSVELSAMQSVTGMLYTPLRHGVAAADFDAATVEAAGRVLDAAYETRVVFHRHQAAAQVLHLRREALAASEASVLAAERLHDAGNLNDLDYAQERAMYEEMRLSVVEAEVDARNTCERLLVRLGAHGAAAECRLAGTLRQPPDDELDLSELPQRAVENSLDLQRYAHRYRARARELDLSSLSGWLPEVHAGVSAEREEGRFAVGPAVEVSVPLFDQGQGRTGRVEAMLRRIAHEHRAAAIALRSATRTAGFALSAYRGRALHYRDVVLPLQERIQQETLRMYNGMFVGVFQLLDAKRRQLAAREGYVRALADYWIARATVEQLLAGRTVGAAESTTSVTAPAGADRGGH